MMCPSRSRWFLSLLLGFACVRADEPVATSGITHEWGVHDPARPRPEPVAPRSAEALAALSIAPAGAVVLFDGTDLAAWQPSIWKVENRCLEVVPKSAPLTSRQAFGSCHLHLEWRAPSPATGEGQNRGNSGVFLQGRYEVQVLDNYENTTYADGYAGAAYGQNPPRVDPCRPAGEWNTYDIFFRAPRFSADGSVTRHAAVTVLFNGVLVQDNFEFTGPTAHKKRPPYSAHPAKVPLELQEHGCRVRFRNIWIVPVAD